MENASQALIIGGIVLISVLVLSMGVYLVRNSSGIGEAYQQTQELTELTKFNSRFTAFQDRTDITAQEIITIANYIRNYNQQNGTSISVFVNGKNYASTTEFTEDNKSQKFIEFITNNSPDTDGKMKYFKCEEVKFTNGKVSSITFSKIT